MPGYAQTDKAETNLTGPLWLICCCTSCMSMDLKLDSPWEEVKEKLKEVNIDLTDEDLERGPGQDQQLLEHLAKKLNRTTEQIRVWIESVSFNKAKAS